MVVDVLLLVEVLVEVVVVVVEVLVEVVVVDVRSLPVCAYPSRIPTPPTFLNRALREALNSLFLRRNLVVVVWVPPLKSSRTSIFSFTSGIVILDSQNTFPVSYRYLIPVTYPALNPAWLFSHATP